MADIQKLIGELTLEEKAGLLSGADFWHTKAVERLGIPSVMVSDGPSGLRKQDLSADHLGVNDSIKAVSFPSGCGTACSYDRELLMEEGKVIGGECQAEDIAAILGPACNIKRSPLCGRNFEYYSEDPYLAGEIATAYIKGVQSMNVGTSLKHFALNNQETRRMSISAEVDERTMNEIYLAAFETPVKEAQPWTVMCSYNKINGVYGSEYPVTLNEALRDKWGYEGFVVSDWSAVNDRVEGLKAGLDLEMPSSYGENDRCIVEAVQNGTLDIAVVDKAVERILNIVFRADANRMPDARFDREADHEASRAIAAESMVLLKNEDAILPIQKGSKVAVVGKYADKPRFQGGGSAHINACKITSFLNAVEGNADYTYAQGFDDTEDVVIEALEAEAVKVAAEADVCIIFAGLPDAFESEGYDRSHMRMPQCQNQLIEKIAAVQKNVVVVLHNGSPVEMPWISKVKAVLEAYLGGQAVGGAVYDVLTGAVNPSGKLAETFPLKLEDNPSYLNFPGSYAKVNYAEGIFVGYRYYDYKKMDVLFPFGHGLSYTTFAYSNLKLDKKSMNKDETLTVTVDVTNTGSVAGKEIVQLYVADQESTEVRPIRELKGFEKVSLAPGETKTVIFALGKRAFAYYEEKVHDWFVEPGVFTIEIGKSSRDLVLADTVTITGEKLVFHEVDQNTLVGALLRDERTSKLAMEMIEGGFIDFGGSDDGAGSEAVTADMMAALYDFTPLRCGLSFGNGKFGYDKLNEYIAKLNALVK